MTVDLEKELDVGDHVIYVDSIGRQRHAVLTSVFGDHPYGGTLPCVNVVFASCDEDKHDPYGRQIERETSVVHKTVQPAHGCYWMHEGDEPNPIQAPSKR